MCFYKNAQAHQPMNSFGLCCMKFTSFFMGNIQNTECKLRNTSFQGNLSVLCRLQWDCLEKEDDQTGGRKGIEAGVIMSTVWTHTNLVSVTHINTSSMSVNKICAICGIPCDSCQIVYFSVLFLMPHCKNISILMVHTVFTEVTGEESNQKLCVVKLIGHIVPV